MSKLELALRQVDGIWQLAPHDKKQGGSLFIDLCNYVNAYQREQIGIRQDIAKAVGCKKDVRPTVLDATAGLASDASLLAYLGCKVCALEQNPTVYTLLTDAFARAEQNCSKLLSNLHLLPQQSAADYLTSTTHHYDVIYLDPMFPERQKSAKVKKGMQYLHQVAGIASAEEESELLTQAREKAKKRVVVKRPRLAPFLAEQKPDFQITGKTIRYDIYLCQTENQP